MTDNEIIKLFREGLGIAQLSDKEWIEQKEARSKRQKAYHAQRAKEKLNIGNPKFIVCKLNRVVVGKPCTRFMALSIVEKAIYNFLMSESKER